MDFCNILIRTGSDPVEKSNGLKIIIGMNLRLRNLTQTIKEGIES